MPTFEETVIATGRDTFWRLDGLDDVHPLLVDKSGNLRHATCYPVGSDGHVHGTFSPVESDAGSFAMSGRVGHWTDTVNRLNTFTWFAFGYSAPSAHPKTLLARSGQWSVGGSCIMGFNASGNTVMGRLKVGGVSYALSAPCVPSTYYFVALRYNAGVIDLLLNAVIVATTGPGVTGDMQVGSSTEFRLGSDFSIIITAEPAAGVDEIATGPTLSDAELLAIYEASLNQLFLHGRSDVVVSATLSSIIEPPPTSYPFRHNWADPLIERLSFRTAISSARTGAEEGNSQRPTPRREFEFVQILKNHAERRRLRAKLWGGQAGKWMIPVRQDAEQLSAAVIASATTVPVTTAYKDYEVGGYIGLRQLDDTGNITHWEEAVVTAVNLLSVECEPLLYDYAANSSLVYPARRALLDKNVSITGHTDSVEELVITARLLPEDEAVIPHRLIPWTPTIKYRDYEVFDPAVWPSNNWDDERSYDIDRSAEEVDFGTGLVGWESDMIGAAESTSYSMLLIGREAIAAFLGWFYERRGRGRYLWVPTMQEDFEILSTLSGNRILVADTNYSDNYALAESRRDLAFIYHDNTMEFRRVVSFSSDVDETLTLGASIPALTSLRSLSLLKFCRLDADQVEFAWHTDDKVVASFRFRELLHSPEGTGLSSASPSHSSSVSLSPSGSASPSSSVSLSHSTSLSLSPSASVSPSSSQSPSHSASASTSPSSSSSPSTSPSESISPSPSV
jgi:hypothetical protein